MSSKPAVALPVLFSQIRGSAAAVSRLRRALFAELERALWYRSRLDPPTGTCRTEFVPSPGRNPHRPIQIPVESACWARRVWQHNAAVSPSCSVSTTVSPCDGGATDSGYCGEHHTVRAVRVVGGRVPPARGGSFRDCKKHKLAYEKRQSVRSQNAAVGRGTSTRDTASRAGFLWFWPVYDYMRLPLFSGWCR